MVTKTIKATTAATGFDVPRIRHLRKGEAVDFAEIGIPHVFLSGTGVKVAEFPDGSISPVLPGHEIIETIERFVFAALVTCERRSLEPAEIRFLRRMMDMTQGGFADAMALARETVSRMENGKDKVTATMAMAIQRLCIPRIPRLLNAIPSQVRRLNHKTFDRVQDFLTHTHDERFRLAPHMEIKHSCPGRVLART